MNDLTPANAQPLPDDVTWIRQCLETTGGLAVLPPNQVAYFNRAVSGLDIAPLIDAASLASAQDAVTLYTTWLGTHGGRPEAAPVWFNVGTLLMARNDGGQAIIAYQNALKLRPELHEASVNLGLALEKLGKPEEALAAWRRSLPAPHLRNLLHTHLGRLLEVHGRLAEAESELRAALLIDPDQPDVQQHFVHMRQRMTIWPVLDSYIPGLSLETQAHNCGPLGALALYDDPALQCEINRGWIDRKVPPAPERLAPVDGYAHDRIRVGYLSTDFCRHAMSFLIAQVLELHDRDGFEVYGYCASPEDGSDIRARVIAAFDHFVPIGELSDEEAARRIRADEIDILIDLNGLTKGARIGALRWKPAPAQATYLGYIGPVPLPELDWLICDEVTIPPEKDAAYLPKPLRLEGCYQANDSMDFERVPVSRAEEGLPEDAFVFCCFSHHYKITPEMYEAWLTIIEQSPGSVLWLVADGPVSCHNLTERWKARGLAPERLIFAPRVDPARYRCRMALADLFLDTSPYNAGTIASDALRMGLPLLTFLGDAFAARMAASLLTAIGMRECIATDLRDYVRVATEIANQPERHLALKAYLASDAWSRTLGNCADFTRRLEAAFREIRLEPSRRNRSEADRLAELPAN